MCFSRLKMSNTEYCYYSINKLFQDLKICVYSNPNLTFRKISLVSEENFIIHGIHRTVAIYGDNPVGNARNLSKVIDL